MTEFEDTDLRGARFREVNLTDATFQGVNLTNVRISEAWLVNVDIDGMFNGLRVNGVDVTAYVSHELARIDPRRALLEPVDPEGMRAAWSFVTATWDATIATRGRAFRSDATHVGRRRVLVCADLASLGVRDRQVVHRTDPRR